VLAVFYQDLVMIGNEAWQNEFMSYILAVPFLFAYLLYRKRKVLRAAMAERQDEQGTTRYLSATAGILLSATAILLYWHGSYTFTPLEYHMMVLPVFASGLILTFFNAQTLRQYIFAVAFLVLLTPPPLEILYGWGSALSVISSQASYSVVRLLRIPATLTSESATPVIQVTSASGATMSFAVDIACSGIYSLVGFLVFAVFTAYIIRDKLWKKLFLFLLGFLLVYAINIVRISTILMIGYQFGEQIAVQLFHLVGGWILIFTGTFILLMFAERILHAQVFSKPTEKCSECNVKPAKNQDFCFSCGRILKPGRIIFGKYDVTKTAALVAVVILLLLVQVPVFALTNGPAQIMIQTPTGEKGNTQLLPQVSGYGPQFLYRDTAFENLSGQEASLMYAYEPLEAGKEIVYVGVEMASTMFPLHRWEYCLNGPGRPVYASTLNLTDIQILDNPPIIARYFGFQWADTKQTEVVLYWFESAVFKTNDTSKQEQVEISLITYPDSPQNLTSKEELLPFATAIAQYWEPSKTWSQAALILSQQGLTLAVATGIPIPVIAVLYILWKRNQRKANARVYLKLSKPTRDIVNMVSETQKTREPTLNAIATTYKSRIATPIERERILEILRETEKTGAIKSEMANVQDQPTKTWKTQMASGFSLASITRSITPRFSRPRASEH
jgi:exosortase